MQPSTRGLFTTTPFPGVMVDATGSPDCGVATASTNTIVLTIYGNFSAGAISGETSANQCYNYDPTVMTANPTGGAGTYTYQWQSSPDGSAWANIPLATAATYNPGAITTTTHYRVMVDATGSPDCGVATASTNTIVLTIYGTFSAGAISGETSATQCYNYDPATMTANPTGGSGTYTYQWQSSPDGTAWTPIAGATDRKSGGRERGE